MEELKVLNRCANLLSKLPKEERRRVVSYLAGIIEEDQMKAAKTRESDPFEIAVDGTVPNHSV
jgi:hypothetical protein